MTFIINFSLPNLLTCFFVFSFCVDPDSPVVFPPFWYRDFDMGLYYSQTTNPNHKNKNRNRMKSKVQEKKAEGGCSHVSKYVFMLVADVDTTPHNFFLFIFFFFFHFLIKTYICSDWLSSNKSIRFAVLPL